MVILEEDKGWHSRYGPLTKEDYEEDELYLEELIKLLKPPQEMNVIVKKEHSRRIELVRKRAMETPTYEDRQHKPKLDLPRPDFTKAVKKILASYKKEMEDIGIKFPKEDEYKRIAEERDLITDVLANQGNVREMMEHLGITKLKKSPCTLIFGDATCKQPLGVIEDYPLKIGNCVIPTNLMVMEMDMAKSLPLILGTPFLATTRASLDFLHMKALLKNVDPYTYYTTEPIEVDNCGMVSSEDVKEEMISLETSEEVKKVMKEAHEVDDYKESLDMFDGGGICLMFETIDETIMAIANEPKGANGKSSEMSKEDVKNKLTLELITKVKEGIECRAIWNGDVRLFY
ncbi:hypothetical protein AALP_AAs50609U000300 [Arabis alpina]|uniref:Uncharacterized protein n=1 Tax=Arabis alpina TaxID=50452 RepID=A0A087FX11_ARAAL|nr:hypothetical protein AALP_AAs50609U000300 [Arabis alpina]